MSKYRQLNKVGIYLRLSKDDERESESLSIENQRLILQEYVKAHGGTLIDEYVDDGYSGTTFDRPGVQRLLTDAKNGRIDTIVVKDLSRFGRNYIQLGNFIDYLFPTYGIRFIAINDSVDTDDRDSASMDMMPIMNIFNEWHSSNTSKKIRKVLEASQHSGKYTSGVYPYGYLVGNDKNRSAVIDEPAAEVVRRIFNLRIKGYSPYRIARILSDEGVPNPTEYRTKKDGSKINREVPHWWSHKTVNTILSDQTYIGCTIQHRRTTVSYKNHKVKQRPESEWIVKENSHEPIISRDIWNKAQEVKNSVARGRITKSQEMRPLTGLLYCEDCGNKMKFSVTKKEYNGKMIEFPWYYCRTYATLGKNYCTTHGIGAKDIENVVLADIRSMLKHVETDEAKARKEFLKHKAQNSYGKRQTDANRLKSKKKRLGELDKLITSAFEEKVLNNMSDSIYQSLCDKYIAEKEALTAEAADLEGKLSVVTNEEQEIDEHIRRLKKYGRCEELTREMCLQLIEFITVDEKKERNNRWHSSAPRNIHIYYKLIDKEKAKEFKTAHK